MSSSQFQKLIHLTIALFPPLLSSQTLLRTLCLSRWLITSPVIILFRLLSLDFDLVTAQWLLLWGFLVIFAWIRFLYCSIFLRLLIAYSMDYSFLSCSSTLWLLFCLFWHLLLSYIFPRHQRIGCDVPQGFPISPLCFSLFIDDMTDVLELSKFHMYADDLQIYYNRPRDLLSECIREVNSDLRRIFEWPRGPRANLLRLNLAKSMVLPVENYWVLFRHFFWKSRQRTFPKNQLSVVRLSRDWTAFSFRSAWNWHEISSTLFETFFYIKHFSNRNSDKKSVICIYFYRLIDWKMLDTFFNSGNQMFDWNKYEFFAFR
jgi:hypothetical protein